MRRAYHAGCWLLALASVTAGCSRLSPRSDEASAGRSGANLGFGPDASGALPANVLRVEPGAGAVVDARSILALDGLCGILEAPASGTETRSEERSPRVVLDFGGEVAGRPQLRVCPGSHGTIEVTLGESLAELEQPGAEHGFPARFEVDAGAGEWWTGSSSGFRYVAVRVRASGREADAVAIDVLRAVGSGLPQPLADARAGSFSSSDSGLDRAWLAGARTARLCLSPDPDGVILDGVKRDRAVWAADVAIAARTLFASSGDAGPVARSLERLAFLREGPASGLQPVASTDHDGGRFDLVEYGAWWLLAVRDYWRETGDEELVRRVFPRIRDQAEWTVLRVTGDGLIVKRADELEWCYSLHREGALTYVNAVESEGLLAAADLARVVGDNPLASSWDRVAVAVRGTTLARSWDPEAGTFATSVEDRARLSLDANVLPLWFDWLPSDDADRVLLAIRSRLWGSWGPVNVDRPYPHPDGPEHDGRVWPFLAYFELDARLRPGRDPSAGFELIRRTWGHMLAHDPGNTFWEWIGPDGDPESPRTSLAHGWSAGVTAALSERVLGVRVIAPRNFEIAPVVGELTHARGSRPTPWGSIQVSWKREPAARRFELHVVMPVGTNVTRFLLPSSEQSRVFLGGRPLAVATDTSLAAELPVISERHPGFVVVHAPPSTDFRLEVVDADVGSPNHRPASPQVGLETSDAAPVG